MLYVLIGIFFGITLLIIAEIFEEQHNEIISLLFKIGGASFSAVGLFCLIMVCFANEAKGTPYYVNYENGELIVSEEPTKYIYTVKERPSYWNFKDTVIEYSLSDISGTLVSTTKDKNEIFDYFEPKQDSKDYFTRD